VAGITIYAQDPAALAGWYGRVLGVATKKSPIDGQYYGELRDRHVGKTLLFGGGGEGGARRRNVMIHYRVEDFDAFLANLGAQGVPIERRLHEPYGRFGYIRDLEGNSIEIWAEP
jgi:predicted enzyme related to lactoylglutathione lyase